MHRNDQPPTCCSVRTSGGSGPSWTSHCVTLDSLARALRDSDDIELDPEELAGLELGHRAIRLDEAVALARVLDMTVDELPRPASSFDERIT